ncbi:MAG: SDR family oxidoreductase, partial [Deltaproteobacteria bacterium]
MKLLLTGATGFVGRNLLIELLKSNTYETIYLPVRSEQKLKEQLRGEGILELPLCVKPLLMEAPNWDFKTLSNVDHVVHGAGVLFGNSLEDYISTNTEGTLNLMRTLIGPSKFVILSSQAASGPCSEQQES